MNKKTQQRRGSKKRFNRVAQALALGGVGLLMAQPATAVEFETGSLKGSFDSTISFGVQRRLQKQDCRIIGNDNGGCAPTSGTLGEVVNGPGLGFTSSPDFNNLQADDGNLNYNKGDIPSATLKGTHELYLKAPQGLSGLLRATWSKDFRADHTRRTPLSEDAKDLAVNNITLLDAWVAKDFTLAGRPAKVKLGNQVISWGEDIFIYGGVNVTNAIDLRKFHTPGTQLKEVFRPAPMISLNTALTDKLSLETYYQFRWNGFQFDPVGTYFSGADVVGRGVQGAFLPSSLLGEPPGSFGDPGTVSNGLLAPPGTRLTLDDLVAAGTFVPREFERKPRKGGQFGAALRYKADNGVEWGAYYLRFHDKLPFIGFGANPGAPGPDSFFVSYGESRNLFGVSANTVVGDVAVGAEISYRPKDSVMIDPTVPLAGPFSVMDVANTTGSRALVKGFVDEKRWQAHLTGFYLVAPSSPLGSVSKALGAAEWTMLGEVAVTYYPRLNRSGAIPYLLPNYELPTKASAGYVLSTFLAYPHVGGGEWNMSPQLDFSHDVYGTTPNALPFVKGRKAMTLSLNFDRDNSKWKVNVGATRFWGGGSNNLAIDRDFFFTSMSRSF
jgi:hypothetical protein